MKLSFVIPAYNASAWLPTAVDSCRKQTYQDIEIIVVNDGSSDSTPQYLEWLANQNDKRINIISTDNHGRSAARNTGNQAATGEVICVLDADDLSYPKRAEIVAREFERGAEVLHGSVSIINAVGKQIGELLAQPFNRERALSEMLNYIVHSTMAYKREFALKFPYRQSLAKLGLDDWGFQIEASLAGYKISHVNNALAVYRSLCTGISKTRDEAKVKEIKTSFLESLRIPA